MMRHVFMILALLLFRAAPTLADTPAAPGAPPPPSLLLPAEGREPEAGFHLFIHRSDAAGLIEAIHGVADGKSAEHGQCLNAAYRPHPSVSERVNARRRLYWRALVEAACTHEVPVELLDAVVLAESRYRATAVSRAGAVGLAQLMPATARELGIVNRTDPRANLRGGARYLRWMLDAFGSPAVAVAAYHAGPGAVQRVGGIPRIGETLRYVRQVMDYWRAGLSSTVQLVGPHDRSSAAAEPRTMARVIGAASQ